MTQDEKNFFDNAFISLCINWKLSMEESKQKAFLMLYFRNEVISKPKQKRIKENLFNFKDELLILTDDEKLVNEWLLIRKNKKAINTETALKSFITEVNKTKWSYKEVVKICVENSWKGFKAEWLNNINLNTQNNGQSTNRNR